MHKAVEMSEDVVGFFDMCPVPMLIFEIESFRILVANAASVQRYGYSREELQAMSIMDLRPPEEVPRIARLASRLLDGTDAAGRSIHLTRSGATFVAEVRTQVIEVGERLCKLAAIHDVSGVAEQEEATRKIVNDAAEKARQADTAARYFAEMFNHAPGRTAILTPATCEVIAVSDGYLEMTGMTRGEVVGHPLPDLVAAVAAGHDPGAAETLRASLAEVAETGREHVIEAMPALFAARAGSGDAAAEPVWDVVNAPLTAVDGSVAFVRHSLVEAGDGQNRRPRGAGGGARDCADHETGFQAIEIERLSRRLAEREALLRALTRLQTVHVWRFDVQSAQLEWTRDLFDLYGVPHNAAAPDLDGYVAMVHPDDRDEMLANFRSHFDGSDLRFSFAHRIIRPDGRIIHVRGEAERIEESGRTVLSGVVQDVTREHEALAQSRRRDALLRIAGEVGRIGGWRVDLETQIVEWSPETARIHETPETREVSVQTGIRFYAPEAREVISERFRRCATSGTPFDEVLQIVTARGNRVWVRSIGAAERDAGGRIVAVHGAFQDLSLLVGLQQERSALQDRLFQMLEGMPEGFITLDTSWRFTYVNRRAETLLQRSRDDLLGRTVWTELARTIRSRFETTSRQAMDTGEMAECDVYYPDRDAWLRVKAYPSDDGIAAYFRDVTRDRDREQRLRLLEAAVARMNDILLITEASPIAEPDGPPIVFVNPAFERLTGYAAAEMIGRTPRILQGPDTDRAELDQIRKALETGEEVRAEVVNYGRDGREYSLEMDIAPLLDETGAATHFVALQRNTTERRAAEARLRLSEERFRLVTQASHDVIWDWDIASGEIWWSDNMLSVFGHDPGIAGAMTGNGRGLVHPDDADRVMTGLMALVEGGGDVWQDDYRLFRADGRTAQVRDRGVVLRDAEGRAVRMIGSLVDVTGDRETEAILRRSQKLEAIGQLTGGVAHDFNNILTVILGNSELLAERLGDRPELHEMAGQVVGAAQRGSELTGRLLAFARQQALDPVVTDLNAAARSIMPLLRRSLGEDVDVQAVLADDLWLVEIDPGQLETALLNLALNARDAMPEGGRLTIETGNARIDAEIAEIAEIEAGHFVVVAVSDTGTGMAPETVEQVLEPFFTTKAQGSGLGLPMVYGFTRQSGGHLKVYSEVGQGTTVKLYFPRAGADAAETPREETPIAAPRGRGEHILVVEDEPFVRRYVVAMIQSLGYRVTEADDAARALDALAAADDIDLLFTDIVMPGGMNGRELADAATGLRPGLRVIYTSGYTENAIVHHGRLDPGVILLSKPYRRQDLAQKLRAVLDGSDRGS